MSTEKRLIDANAFMAYIDKQYCTPCKANGQDYHEIRCRACWVDDMSIELDAIPTVDAVEVVRCKDCKYYSNGWLCNLYLNVSHEMKPDDFCSYGERREGE